MEKKSKILICITKSNWGGAQKYVYDIAISAQNNNYDVTVLLGGAGELKQKLLNAGVKIINLKNSQRDVNLLKEFNLLYELIKIFIKERPDIIHLNSTKIGFIGALSGRIVGVKKIIFTVHGWAFNENKNIFQKVLLKIMQMISITLSHRVIAVSQSLKKQVKIFNKKIVVINNGIEKINFKNKETARNELFAKNKNIKTNNEAVWIGTISELHENKGLTYAIEAIALINEKVIFLIIGEGEEKKPLENKIKSLGLEEKVFLLGSIENAAMYLKAFDIFTLTSITESLGYVLLEAGMASIPVLASNVGGIPEIIEVNKTGLLVNTKSPVKIKEGIIELIKNPKLVEKIEKNLKEKIESSFTIEQMVSKTLKIYE